VIFFGISQIFMGMVFWKYSQSQVDADMEYWKSQVLRSIIILTDPSHNIMRWAIVICNNYDLEQAVT
jgi:hypothetical protein